MDIFLIADSQVTYSTALPEAAPARGFLWLDATHDEVAADPERWREQVARATGTRLYDPHLSDVVNLAHPSYFDSTNDYAMLVFRKLALLDARIELRKLDHLCEEQHDALQELRDHVVDTAGEAEISRSQDLLLVRINDVMEHVTRVLNHARRLEASIESAVQIHFSAMSHRTSEIMRTLTVITALFMPLTLITGIFGMNFVEMPLLKDGAGFWLTMGAMALIVVIMLFFFRRRRYLDEPTLGHRRRDRNRHAKASPPSKKTPGRRALV